MKCQSCRRSGDLWTDQATGLDCLFLQRHQSGNHLGRSWRTKRRDVKLAFVEEVVRLHTAIHVGGAHKRNAQPAHLTSAQRLVRHRLRTSRAGAAAGQRMKRSTRAQLSCVRVSAAHSAPASGAVMLRILLLAAVLLAICSAEDPSDPSFLLNRIYTTYTEGTESPCVRLLNGTSHIGCGGMLRLTIMLILTLLYRGLPSTRATPRFDNNQGVPLFSRIHRRGDICGSNISRFIYRVRDALRVCLIQSKGESEPTCSN